MGIHLIPFLTDLGIDPFKAAAMVAIMRLAGMPTNLISGFFADRVKKQHLRFLIGGAYLLQAIGISLFLLNRTIPMIYVWFICYGIGNGAAFALMNPLRGRYFGRKAFGSIMGSSSLFMTPVGVAAPIYAGWVYDTSGSYISAFTLFAGFLILSAAIMSFVFPPKPPAQITSIHKIL